MASEAQLCHIKCEDIPDFSLHGIETRGKVVDIYDGDTCKIVILIGEQLQKHTCRLVGLDTPEMKPLKSKPNREKEIEAAQQCRNKLIQLVTNCELTLETKLTKPECKKLMDSNTNIISVKCHEFDKYGRLLVSLYTPEGNCVNDILVAMGFAKNYDGGTKNVFNY